MVRDVDESLTCLMVYSAAIKDNYDNFVKYGNWFVVTKNGPAQNYAFTMTTNR